MENYGFYLKNERIARNLSQKKIADAIGITQQAISLYENGTNEPTIGICVKLADFYGITVDELIGRDKNSSPIIDQKFNQGIINNNF